MNKMSHLNLRNRKSFSFANRCTHYFDFALAWGSSELKSSAFSLPSCESQIDAISSIDLSNMEIGEDMQSMQNILNLLCFDFNQQQAEMDFHRIVVTGVQLNAVARILGELVTSQDRSY